MKANATYTVKKWEEKVYDQISANTKLAKATVEYGFTGEMEGTASVEYLMHYSHDDPQDPHKSTAKYIGLIRFRGTVGHKTGTFVMQDDGKFEGGVARSSVRIAEGSGTESLRTIVGSGTYWADQKGCHFELNYTLQ